MNPVLLRQACLLDAAGVIPGVKESEEDFFLRAQRTFDVQRKLFNSLTLNKKELIFDGIEIDIDRKVEDSLLEDSRSLTDNLYGFRVEHIPGFFLSKSVGPLWGGCLIGDPDIDLAVFFLRDAFKEKEKWLFYSRTELGAHELCHSARYAINDPVLEEFFAYQTSSSKLRRYLGNCFIRDIDALLFVLPALLLPVVQFLQIMFFPRLMMFPFWMLALAYPCYLLMRNQKAHNMVKKACRILKKAGVAKSWAVLFRMTSQEIAELGKIDDNSGFEQYIRNKADAELRWKVIENRFIKFEDNKDGQIENI